VHDDFSVENEMKLMRNGGERSGEKEKLGTVLVNMLNKHICIKAKHTKNVAHMCGRAS